MKIQITKQLRRVLNLAFRMAMKEYGVEITFTDCYEVIEKYSTFKDMPEFMTDFIIDFLMDIEGNVDETYTVSEINGEMYVHDIPQKETEDVRTCDDCGIVISVSDYEKSYGKCVKCYNEYFKEAIAKGKTKKKYERRKR